MKTKKYQLNLTDFQRDLALAIYEGVDYHVNVKQESPLFIKTKRSITWKVPKYNSSLDALLPIIEKIEGEDVGRGVILVEITGNYCRVAFNDEGESIYAEYFAQDVKTKVEAVYKAVSDYCYLITKEKLNSTK